MIQKQPSNYQNTLFEKIQSRWQEIDNPWPVPEEDYNTREDFEFDASFASDDIN
jgi:hypothetical protein